MTRWCASLRCPRASSDCTFRALCINTLAMIWRLLATRCCTWLGLLVAAEHLLAWESKTLDHLSGDGGRQVPYGAAPCAVASHLLGGRTAVDPPEAYRRPLSD